MRLLIGPPGSGKTFRILADLRAALARGDSGVRLLTPTATMARHFQSRLAREGFVFRPGLIQTLSHFVDAFAAGLPQVSKPLLYLLVEAAARRANRPEFAQVVRLPGFCAALARAMEEFSAAGCDAARLAGSLPRKTAAPLGEAFLAVYREVDGELSRRGLATRSQRLVHAAERIASDGLNGVHTIWLDGFYALPDPELAVIGALCRHAEVTLTLPSADLTEATRQRLLALGFAEELCDHPQAPARVESCVASSIEREADEIARRILEQAAAGRPFREMGIIVRSPEGYAPILSTTLDRFGIPASFYFDADLSRHALVRYLSGAVDAMLAGWDHEETLRVVRLAPGVASDQFDFAVREVLPGAGLAALQELAANTEPGVIGLLQSFEQLGTWRSEAATPAAWAGRLKALRALFRPLRPDPVTFDASMGRSQAAALQLFEAALDETGGALGDRPVPLHEFWHAAKSVLRLTPLRMDDRRRDVVHVLGAHEARQWRLPVVFVCGLVEQQFPRFHAQDPFFPEAARAHLQRSGIRLRAAADFEAEERFLFDCAVTRATGLLTLTGVSAKADALPAVRPQSGRQPDAARPPAAIGAADLLPVLAGRHTRFRPTGLESYLQCAFQFFGRETLRLKGAPPRPEQRLDYRGLGTIVHAALAELHRDGQTLDEVFDRVFRRICEQQRVPPGYRTESLRLRMLADLRALMDHPDWAGAYETLTEQKFRFTLAPDVEISGRIDRLDLAGDGGAYVIDYKYSGAQGTKGRAEDENLLQPQLYILAVERFFALRPLAMFYWGLKGGIVRKGWNEPFPPGWREQAVETVLRIAGEIRAGRIEVSPSNPDKCRFCDFRDVCRFEAAAGDAAEGASSWD